MNSVVVNVIVLNTVDVNGDILLKSLTSKLNCIDCMHKKSITIMVSLMPMYIIMQIYK